MTDFYKDAIGNCQCKTCPYFHVPRKGPIGACVYNPPVPFIVGAVPQGGPLVDPSKPQQMMPLVHAYYAPVEETSGCGRHPHRAENRPMVTWPAH
jgi:hypothetical protein